MVRKTPKPPISPTARRDVGVVINDPAGHPSSLPFSEFASLAGLGNVVGPASSTDKAIARFNGTTGKLLENSLPIVQDDGRISTVTDPTSAQDAATKAYVDAKLFSTFTLLTADPGSPADDTWWVRRTGTSPTMSVALRARISGVTYTLAEMTL